MNLQNYNQIKNWYFNKKLANNKTSLIVEVKMKLNNKPKIIQQLNILGGIDIFDLNGNVIILDI